MNRRQMLTESVRSLSKALPAVLGVAGGLLKLGDDMIPERRAGCFPAKGSKQGDEVAHECSDGKDDRG